jgi:hypothetical protein
MENKIYMKVKPTRSIITRLMKTYNKEKSLSKNSNYSHGEMNEMIENFSSDSIQDKI